MKNKNEIINKKEPLLTDNEFHSSCPMCNLLKNIEKDNQILADMCTYDIFEEKRKPN